MLLSVLIHLQSLSWQCWTFVYSGFSPSLHPLRACLCVCVDNCYLKMKWHLIQSFLPKSAGVALQLMPQLGVFTVGTLNLSEMVGQKTEAFGKKQEQGLVGRAGLAELPREQKTWGSCECQAQKEEGAQAGAVRCLSQCGL